MRLKCASTFLILLLPILFFYGCESTSSSSDGQGQEALPQSVETAKVELIRTQSFPWKRHGKWDRLLFSFIQ